MRRTADDFAGLMVGLLPQGPLWDFLASCPTDSLRYQRYRAYAEEFARIDNRRADLLVEAVPSTTLEKLPDWEEFLGITPEPDHTIEERRFWVIAKLFSSGDQSVPFYEGFGDILGHNLTVRKFKPLQFGDRFGSRFCSVNCRWLWHFVTDQPGPDPAFEQRIRELTPSHIVVHFIYNGGN